MDALLNSLITEPKKRYINISSFKPIKNAAVWIFTCPIIREIRNRNRSKYFISTTSPVRKARASDE